MIKFIKKWLQKLKHKPQLSGEQNQQYPVQEFMQKQKPLSSNPQRTTEKSTQDKEGNTAQTYEEIFNSIDEDLLLLMAYSNWNKFRGFCASVNIEIHLQEEFAQKAKKAVAD